MTYKTLSTIKSDFHTRQISVWGKKTPKYKTQTKPKHRHHPLPQNHKKTHTKTTTTNPSKPPQNPTLEQMLTLLDALLGI